MDLKNLMTSTPTCCTPDTSLADVARMMVDNDCGQIPVVESLDSMKLTGVVTDRDIAVRGVATGRDTRELKAGDCMTSPAVSVKDTATFQECCDTMEEHQIRRVPVVDSNGCVCGIVAQADVALCGDAASTAEMVEKVSAPKKA